MAFGKVQYLRDLCFGHFVSIHPTQPHALLVDMKHDTCGLFPGAVEELFQNVHDELHRRVIIVQQEHTIERRLFRAHPCLGGQAKVCTILITGLPAPGGSPGPGWFNCAGSNSE